MTGFFKSRGFLYIIAIAAVIVLSVAIGPVRRSAGDFLASIFNITQRTFSPDEVYIGEVSLGEPVGSSESKSEPSAGFMRETGASPAKTVPVPVNSSKDKLISEMNDKINQLQAKLNAVSIPTPTSTVVTQPQPQIQTNPQQDVAPVSNPAGEGKILIGEIMAGADGNSNYEFIELYNAGSVPVDLTGWSVKKKSSTGSESSLVAASRLSGKIIQPGKYLLLGNEAGYQGSVALDIPWPSSYTLAYTNNSIVLYNNGAKVEEIFWAEIPKGQGFTRVGWNSSQFTLTSSPTPQNSQSQ